MTKSERSNSIRSLLHDLTKAENRHYLLLLYWPFYIAAFFTVERFGASPRICTSCALDHLIPFCEYFIAAYLLWFPFWIGMLAYAMRREPELFKQMMCYLILTFSTAIALYWLFPNYQDLRPDVFPRSNLSTCMLRLLYWIDTNTNVCPSEHVVGALAVVFAVWNSKRFSTTLWRIVSMALAALISLSTLFIKQHALLDLAAALPLAALGWLVCFYLPRRRKHKVRYISMAVHNDQQCKQQ